MNPFSRSALVSAVLCTGLGASAVGQTSALGDFEGQGDIGATAKAGSLEYNRETGKYLIGGGGENMWFTNDAMHYVWKKMSGDLTFAADIRWPTPGGNAHRKACLVIRQTLEPDSAYADVAVHGEGLTSLQYRENANELTHEIQSSVTSPSRVRLEKHGDYVSMSLAALGETLHPAGGAFRILFKEPFYVGLAVCAHDNKVLEKAEFSRVEITPFPASTANAGRKIASTLEVIPIGSKDRRSIFFTTDRIESPNWSHDGSSIVYNGDGRLYKIPVVGGQPEKIDTGKATHCTRNHGLSPDGGQLAITDEAVAGKTLVYTLPFAGGKLHQLTPESLACWEAWSADGSTLVIKAARNGQLSPMTILAINRDGSNERTIPLAPQTDSNPDFSPDGKSIYFQSGRSGSQQIWRMTAQGTGQELVARDEHDLYDYFCPHPSPDGRWIVFLAAPKSKTKTFTMPLNEDVLLMMAPTAGGPAQTLAKLLGGEGSMAAPSWSPDSRRLAFVSYQYVYP